MNAVTPQPKSMICPGTQPFVRNQWYAIAFSHEVEAGQKLHRKCMDEPILLFRTDDGRISALFDRCPHRAVPLSMGRIVGQSIECAYHGIQFDGTGACTLIPTQTMMPPRARVRSYPVAERMQFIWIWMGDPAEADESLLLDYADCYCEGDGWQHATYFMMEIRSNYSMLFENLLDTSHISYLHIGGIDDGKMASSPYTVETKGQMVTLERFLDGDAAGPGTAKLFSMPVGTNYSRRLTTRSLLPNVHLVRNEITFLDEPGRPPNVRVNIMPITPASGDSLYQFVVVSTSYPVTVTQDLKDQLWGVFLQDASVLEAIQTGYEAFGPDPNEISLKADVAALNARRIITKLAKQAVA
ncbi:aromatic ring-hydroxylating dioxygenase subunit alpha [Novosphingobium flavum]|uniref:aromatic ring-hydroxylating dioxygenase subunit alpha n=1 Tax=Novosphingobium aerophilum TaxID=2839843 RepID=UPI00163A552F|nr:aromatic ring-hydroxylating dioxygenase subunit alpha [Novosphingobium aerophilum]MBC2662788.1 aromatic ring-hydroxylating dioxygenase subunit alpha [Novosphingobium aerophilum]